VLGGNRVSPTEAKTLSPLMNLGLNGFAEEVLYREHIDERRLDLP